MLLTRSPLAARLPRAAARLACVKHSASVQSEPGSNSSVQSLRSLTQFTDKANFLTLTSSDVSALLLIYLRTNAQSYNLEPSFHSAPARYLRFQHPANARTKTQQAPTPIGCSFVKDLLRSSAPTKPAIIATQLPTSRSF